jgi:hypothetical protein
LLGSIAAFLALAVAGLTSQDTQMMRAAYPAMELITRFVIVPLTFASLLQAAGRDQLRPARIKNSTGRKREILLKR